MASYECYHCKQWIAEGEAHDCWTTTEAALTADLSDDLRDAWERLRETAEAFGEQRIYASHSSVMFSRRACYFFVRPKRRYLEVCVFLGRTIVAPQIRRALPSSRTKVAHLLRIRHRDEVEAPITDWLAEAYAVSDDLGAAARARSSGAAARRGGAVKTGRTAPAGPTKRRAGSGGAAASAAGRVRSKAPVANTRAATARTGRPQAVLPAGTARRRAKKR